MNAKGQKVALVTGGGRGIGAAIARELAAAGMAVAVNYARNDAEANKTVKAIKDARGTAVAIRGDVQNPKELERLFAAVRDQLGPLDVLVNNAGVSGTSTLDGLTADAIDRTLNINLKAAILAMQQAARAFGKDGGAIVNISSVLSRGPAPGFALYAASKAGLEAVTRVLAQELGPRRIRVNAVAPGSTEAGLLIEGGLNDDVRGYLASKTALGRVGQPADIAKVVAFLASDSAAWITGQIIDADGGLRV